MKRCEVFSGGEPCAGTVAGFLPSANRSGTVTEDAVLAGKGRFTEDEPPF